jgi:hypothetical protein
MGKGKLHELLAVEADLEGRVRNIMNETRKVFKDKPALFMGAVRTYHPFVEDGIDYPEEHQALTSTVDEKLAYTSNFVASYYDALLQKEATNQVAKAVLVVDGEVIAEELPATFLLGMETRLRKLREVYAHIPTLAVGTEWKKDESKGEGVWVVANPEETLKTVRTVKSKVLYEATEHHPAQIDKWEESETVGKYTKVIWCGMLTPARKSELLDRIDKLIQGVKKARQRANSTEVVKINVGQKIMDYINK